jgi:hypothetical protein
MPIYGGVPAAVALTNASQQLGTDGVQAHTTIKRGSHCPAGLSDIAKAKHVLSTDAVDISSTEVRQ